MYVTWVETLLKFLYNNKILSKKWYFYKMV